MTPFVKDAVGRQIKPGCTVMYPVRRGSNMWLSELRVQQIVPGDSVKGPYLSGFSNVGRRINVHNLENVIVIVPLGTRYEMGA
jgi:hypothetical protein